MNSFCGLFFVTLLVYVQADVHPCDPWAADIEIEGKDAHPNPHKNQAIPYKTFIQNPKEPRQFYVSWATTDEQFDSFKDFCTAPTHGGHCGDVYLQTVITNPDTLLEGKKPTLRRKTHFYAQNEKTQKLTAYTIEFKLVDDDDYIFEAVKDSLKAYLEDGQKLADIPPEIQGVLNSPFALHRYEDNYSIYITCDAKHAWVVLKPGVTADSVKNDVEKKLDELAEIKADNKSFSSYRKNAKQIKTDYSPYWVNKFTNVINPLIPVH